MLSKAAITPAAAGKLDTTIPSTSERMGDVVLFSRDDR